MRTTIAFLGLLLLPLPGLAQSWQGSGSVGVRVKGADGDVVAEAEVVLRHLRSRGVLAPISTDGDGRARIGQLAEGQWEIEIRHPGHMAYRATILVLEGKKAEESRVVHEARGAGGPLKVSFFRVRGDAVVPEFAPSAAAAAGEPAPPTPAPPPAPTPPPEATAPAAPAPPAPAPPPVPTSEPMSPAASPTATSPPAAPSTPAEAAPSPPVEERLAATASEPVATEPVESAPEPPVEAPRPEPAPEPPVAPPPVAPPPVSTPPVATRPAPGLEPPADATPAPSETAPVASPPSRGSLPVAPGLPAAPPAAVRSFAAGTCFDCQQGEAALAASRIVAPGAEGCPETLASDLTGVVEALEGADSAGGFVVLGEGSTSTGIGDAPLASTCGAVAVILPRGAKFSGYRYEAWDEAGGGDCLADRECPLGQGRWSAEPQVVRRGGLTLVAARFSNLSPDRPRRVILTAYFSAAE